MSKLTGKVAVVTGASKGIGAGIARRLAAEGAAVVVNYASSREGADKVVADIESAGGKAVAVQGNVAAAADVNRMFAEAKSAFGSSTSWSTTRASTGSTRSRRSPRTSFTGSSTPTCSACCSRPRRPLPSSGRRAAA